MRFFRIYNTAITYSNLTWFACTRLVPYCRRKRSMKSSRNVWENVSINLSGFSATNSSWRWCDSDIRWHLKPFSSRHCFWHIWQYQRNFCRPFALILFDMALGVKKPAFSFPIVHQTALKSNIRRLTKKFGQIAKYILAECQAHVNKPWA